MTLREPWVTVFGIGDPRPSKQKGPVSRTFLNGRYWARTSDPQLVDYGKAKSGVVRACSNAGLRAPRWSGLGTLGQGNLTQI